jgi:hypothetical protein
MLREMMIANLANDLDLFKEMEKAQHEKTYNQSFMSNFPTFEDYYSKTYESNEASLIPITQEWLLKFGFKEFIDFEYKTGMFDKFPLSIGFSYSMNTKKVMIIHEGNKVSHWINKKIEYVHELQNLYFALTGQELTYGGNK